MMCVLHSSPRTPSIPCKILGVLVCGLSVFALHIHCIVSTVALHSCEWRVHSSSGAHCDRKESHVVRVYSLRDFLFGRSAPLRVRVPGFPRNYARACLDRDRSPYPFFHTCMYPSISLTTVRLLRRNLNNTRGWVRARVCVMCNIDARQSTGVPPSLCGPHQA
jgi:hypothetical protein